MAGGRAAASAAAAGRSARDRCTSKRMNRLAPERGGNVRAVATAAASDR